MAPSIRVFYWVPLALPNCVNTSAQPTTVDVPDGGTVIVQREGEGNGAANVRWSEIISPAALDAEIREVHEALEKDLSSLEKFQQGGYKTARRHFSELAMLLAITAEHDGEAKYKECAATASARFSEVASRSKAGTANAYQHARQSLSDLSEMLRGKQPQGAPAKIDWSRVADRAPLMQRLGIIDREVFSKLADEQTFAENRNSIGRHAECVAAIGVVLRQPGMPQADHADYQKYAQELSDQARQLAQFAAQNDHRQAAETVTKMHGQCANCHAKWR